MVPDPGRGRAGVGDVGGSGGDAGVFNGLTILYAVGSLFAIWLMYRHEVRKRNE